MQCYDISTLHLGSAIPIEQNPVSFKRTVYIKFELDSAREFLSQNFDEYVSELETEDKPTEIMRKSIEIHRDHFCAPVTGI